MIESKLFIENILFHLGRSPITNVITEAHNQEYEGMLIQLEDTTYRSRLAKATPKKKGYFVVFWEKDENNKNQAYSFLESPAKVIISIMDENLRGQFVFPKSILLKKGILRSENSKGKMAIRVYPAWERELNKTAAQTQKWQQKYFVDLTDDFHKEKLEALYFN
ncbi:MepB family protein [Terribacillus saccharophilus]|uniref:MepB family protein n=1 Tax=Terribacillus saccharophilus TaxID=361277 RepID=UPI0039828759